MEPFEFLITLFDEMQKDRKDLPIEITRLFGDDEKCAVRKSVVESFKNVERVLDFRHFSRDLSSDAEDLWYDLLTTLDDVSYYACLSAPLVRQILVPSSRYLFCESVRRDGAPTSKAPEDLPVSLPPMSSTRKVFVEKALFLASDAGQVYELYSNIEIVDDLIAWAKRFLSLSGGLIQITSDISLMERNEK